MEINSRSLPCRWQLMLCCQVEGKAAKGLVTCQSPHVPESLTTRQGGIEEKSEPRVLWVSMAIYQQRQRQWQHPDPSSFNLDPDPSCFNLDPDLSCFNLDPDPKSDFPCSKFDFLQQLSDFREIRENLLQQLSAFRNGFLLSSTPFRQQIIHILNNLLCQQIIHILNNLIFCSELRNSG